MPSSSKSYDVVVVGAGVIGLACGWRAAQRGRSVLAIDRASPGAGASGVAAGMLAPVTEAAFGEQGLLELNLESARLWPRFAAEVEDASGQEIGYASTGAIVVAADADEARELRRLHEFKRSLGLDAEWLSGRQCRALEPGLAPRVAGGILAPGDAYVDPPALVRALAGALVRAGGEIAAETEAAEILTLDGAVTGVGTPAGEIFAGSVVIAAGAWSGALSHPEAPPVRPVKGQVLELRVPAGARRPASRLIRTPSCYLVSRGDGRVTLGATVEERGFDGAVTAGGLHELLEAAREVLPDVDELELVEARAGLRPGTPDNLPVIGAGATDGLIWATGHHRNGVLLAPLTGAAVAGLLTGEPVPRWGEHCSPLRFGVNPEEVAAPIAGRL